MSGGLAKRPMPKREEYINPEEELRLKIEEQKRRVDAQAGTTGTDTERYRRLKMGSLPMPQKPIEEPQGEQMGDSGTGDAIDNPEDYVVVNSPTEGVFLKNKKTGQNMSLMSASQIAGFEDLVSQGTQVNQSLLKQGLEKK